MEKSGGVTLALGGGGARGLAHIGVLKVLEREKIPIDSITGSSIGALVGAAYAVRPDAAFIENLVADILGSEGPETLGLRLLEKIPRHERTRAEGLRRLAEIAAKEMVFNMVLVRKALLSEEELRQAVAPYLADIDVAETSLPFAATAVDLVSGRKVTLTSGPLIPAVMASCAVPGFMPPVAWEDMLLVDGGVIDPVPAEEARRGRTGAVLGVDVGAYLSSPASFDDGIDVVRRVMDIMITHLARPGRQQCDLLIEPDVDPFHWTDFSRFADIIACGETTAAANIDRIRDIVSLQEKEL